MGVISELPVEEKDFILSIQEPVPDSKFCVYFLIKDNEIVYVGKTKGCHWSRIGAHIAQKAKDFDNISVACCDTQEEMDILEVEYILKFQPKYNGPVNTAMNLLGVADRVSLSRMGYKWMPIKKAIKEGALKPCIDNIAIGTLFRVDEIIKLFGPIPIWYEDPERKLPTGLRVALRRFYNTQGYEGIEASKYPHTNKLQYKKNYTGSYEVFLSEEEATNESLV